MKAVKKSGATAKTKTAGELKAEMNEKEMTEKVLAMREQNKKEGIEEINEICKKRGLGIFAQPVVTKDGRLLAQPFVDYLPPQEK